MCEGQVKKMVGAIGFGFVGLPMKDACRQDVIMFRA